MKSLILALAILSCAPLLAVALSEGEIDVLSAIVKRWPVLGAAPSNWNPANISAACSQPIFSGLSCSGGSNPHVTGIVFRAVPLIHPIPPEIGDLPWLEQLVIETCLTTGTITEKIGSAKLLKSLVLRYNRLTGTIPATLGALENLEKLQIEENLMTGTLPASLSRLSKLTFLDIEGSGFTGSMPDSYAQLTALTMMWIIGDSLTQPIPSWMDSLVNLKDVKFVGGFIGTLPPSLLRMPALKSLSLSNTGISGTIPSDIDQLQLLESLRLSSTQLSGTLPPTIGNLTQLVSLDYSYTYITGPLPAEFINLKNLQIFIARGLHGSGFGTIPNEIGRLTKLSHLELSESQVVGTIPPSIGDLAISDLLLDRNQLVGEIPRFPRHSQLAAFRLNLESNQLASGLENLAEITTPIRLFTLNNNKFAGTIPSALLYAPGHYLTLNLDNNRLSGTIPDHEHAPNELRLSNNELVGPVPQRGKWSTLDLSLNYLNGTIPAVMAANQGLRKLNLSYNRLIGNLEGWGSQPWTGTSFIYNVDFSHNLLSGQVDSLQHLRALVINLRHNNLSGTIPMFNDTTEQVYLSYNNFTTIDTTPPRNPFQLGNTSSLRRLDLSHNQLQGHIPIYLVSYSISFLYLNNNQLSGFLPAPVMDSSSMTVLDLSFNQLIEISVGTFPQLISLKANDNRLSGRFNLHLPLISSIDISNNYLSFSLGELSQMQNLATLYASNNRIRGLPVDLSLPSLETVDLSHNALGHPDPSRFGLDVLSTMFKHRLRQFIITNNPLLPITQPDPSRFGPWRTTQSQPSVKLPSFVTCFSLTFAPQDTSANFRYDEGLFGYSQCDCSEGFYGVPPNNCFFCPANADCGARTLTIHRNFFIYGNSKAIEVNNTSNTDKPTSIGARATILETESCITTLSTSESSCVSITATVDVGDDAEAMLSRVSGWNGEECVDGSSGRLCSHCSCDIILNHEVPQSGRNVAVDRLKDGSGEVGRSCYFRRGSKCVKCTSTLSLSQSIPIVVCGVLVVYLVGSVVMVLVLRSKRRRRDESWDELSIRYRIWIRLTEATNIGMISIIVLFVQLLAELTHWDNYLFQAFAQLSNGNGSALGIVCLLPDVLSKPLNDLVLRLMVPVAVALILGGCIGSASLVTRLIDWKSHRNAPVASDMDSSAESFEQLKDMYEGVAKHSRIEYPASALLLSTTISVLQFFYFGIALSSTEYFFGVVQRSSGLKYIQAHPWMLYSDGLAERRLSLPWIVIVVFGVPALFVWCSWYFRHQIMSPQTSAWLGSIFNRFDRRWYWWEIVNVGKKLSIALLLRGLSPTNALQAIFIILSIGLPQLAQTTFRPWKRKMENVADACGGLLLISSLFASNAQNYSDNAVVVLYFILSLDLAFILALIVWLVHESVTRKTDYERIWEGRFGALITPDNNGFLLNDEIATGPHIPLLRESVVKEHTQLDSDDGIGE